jgi:hypothetical protein
MLRNGAHGIVGDAGRHRAAKPGRIGEEWIKRTVATLILLARSRRDLQSGAMC